jgi:hypothetical protein
MPTELPGSYSNVGLKYIVRWAGRVWFRIRTSGVIWERSNESSVFHMGLGDLVTIWAAVFTSFSRGGKSEFVGSVPFKDSFTEEAFMYVFWNLWQVTLISQASQC